MFHFASLRALTTVLVCFRAATPAPAIDRDKAPFRQTYPEGNTVKELLVCETANRNMRLTTMSIVLPVSKMKVMGLDYIGSRTWMSMGAASGRDRCGTSRMSQLTG